MKTVRITKTPPGKPHQVVPGVPYIGQTIGQAEEGTGTINAEGGETIVGDVNRDGMLEHMRIVGPSHGRGGVDLDVEPGSFVYSNSKKLRIKDEEVLKRFTKSVSKKGSTPAEIARQYDINTHIQTLKDPLASPIAKRTAQLMIDTNTQKLAELALVQEGMKGFPNGVPDIASQLLPQELTDQVAPEEAEPEQPMMRMGGELQQFQAGGQKPRQDSVKINGIRTLDVDSSAVNRIGKKLLNENTPDGVDQDTGQPVPTPAVRPGQRSQVATPTKGAVIYMGEKPVKVKSVDPRKLLGNPNAAYITLENGMSFSEKDWVALHGAKPLMVREDNKFTGYQGTSGQNNDRMPFGLARFDDDKKRPVAYSVRPQKVVRSFGKDLKLGRGDVFKFADEEYEVIDPHGEYDPEYARSFNRLAHTFDDTQGQVKVRNKKTNKTEFLQGEDIVEMKQSGGRFWNYRGADQIKAERDMKLKQARDKAAPGLRAQHDAEQATHEYQVKNGQVPEWGAPPAMPATVPGPGRAVNTDSIRNLMPALPGSVAHLVHPTAAAPAPAAVQAPPAPVINHQPTPRAPVAQPSHQSNAPQQRQQQAPAHHAPRPAPHPAAAPADDYTDEERALLAKYQ